MKKIDSIQFQNDYLTAMQEASRPIYLSIGYSLDVTRFEAKNVKLVTDEAGLVNYWQIDKKRNDDCVCYGYLRYAVDSCRILAYDPYGRALVHDASRDLFIKALDDSNVWEYEKNRRHDNALSICNNLDTGNRGLDYSTIQYAGEFQFNDPETATFLPAGKPSLIDKTNGKAYDKLYQTQKIGKAVRYICDCLGICYTDHHIETIVNIIKAENMPVEFQYTSNRDSIYDISDIYNLEHANGCGSLGGSCMRGLGSYYHDLDGCDNVEAVYTLNQNGELTSRALLWTTRKGTKILDRIYGSDSMITAYKELARNSGYWYKEYQSYDSRRQFVNPDGDYVRASFAIEIDLSDSINDDSVPYMDTFCFYNSYEGILSNCSDVARGDSDGHIYELRSTDGEAVEY